MNMTDSAPVARDIGGLALEGREPRDKIVALGGNPNVGKSTVFNALTGLRQHTGNWPGKTVANAQGRYRYQGQSFILVDVPGTYSLLAGSADEEAARDFICFGNPDVTLIVADATCLERNLNLVLQVLEATPRAVLCVNLMDEAKKKRIHINLSGLSVGLGIPVVGTSARSGKGLERLMAAVDQVARGDWEQKPFRVVYDEAVEAATALLAPAVEAALGGRIPARWAALRLLEGDESLLAAMERYLGVDLLKDEAVARRLTDALLLLSRAGIDKETFKDKIVAQIVGACEDLYRQTVTLENSEYRSFDRKLDRFLTSKATGIPVMLLGLLGVFWLTISGSNVPSALLSNALFSLIAPLEGLFSSMGAAPWLISLAVHGVYKTLAWVVSVMLPPMAIFFPLFTLLEDLGYLPRVAFNLDNYFQRACAHGKQSLTMCMGFGCNACGVIGCRIIDSPRERLIAILTNNFVPCNGRFPTLIAVITMFFAGAGGGFSGSVIRALMLTGLIVLGVGVTLLMSKLLSKTLLRGVASSFQLELPPYRRPQIGRVIVRSVLDRTLFVLGRAALVAAPAGAVIWLMANVQTGGGNLLSASASFLDPFARLMGLDGFILMAFILGLPANEVVVPILIMSYMATGSLTEPGSLSGLRALLAENGWTWLTGVSVMLFSLMHWPCATTLLTIHKETKSLKWTLLAFLLPTLAGVLSCMLLTLAVRIWGLAALFG